MSDDPLPMADTEPRRSRVLRALAALGKTAATVVPLVAVLTAARSTLADQYQVPTSSMWPTIEPGDRIFVAKAAYDFRVPFTDDFLAALGRPDVGDVIVFADPRGGPIPFVKRVVALPGQSVALAGGVLFLDGHAQRLERLADGRMVEHLGWCTHETGRRDDHDFGPIVVPPNQVFVMGDNRAISLDSRMLGTIPFSLLRGRVLGTVFHYDDVDGFDPERFSYDRLKSSGGLAVTVVAPAYRTPSRTPDRRR